MTAYFVSCDSMAQCIFLFLHFGPRIQLPIQLMSLIIATKVLCLTIALILCHAIAWHNAFSSFLHFGPRILLAIQLMSLIIATNVLFLLNCIKLISILKTMHQIHTFCSVFIIFSKCLSNIEFYLNKQYLHEIKQ